MLPNIGNTLMGQIISQIMGQTSAAFPALSLAIGFALLSVLIWLYLLGLRGQFWRSDQFIESVMPHVSPPSPPASLPRICAVIPARNEADLLPITLRSLLNQDYPGEFQIIVVDDHSTDGTAQAAIDTAATLKQAHRLEVLQAAPLPPKWTGKLWAMEQGIQKAQQLNPNYILLTDADIQHDLTHLSRLVTKASQDSLALVSVMVRLRCDSFWERLLIPAFVFFFEKLYPFRWVNDPNRPTAAAAGGCILIQQDVLEAIGGIASIRDALIDDCALAKAVKHRNLHLMKKEHRIPKAEPSSPIQPFTAHSPLSTSYSPIWLGLSDRTFSLRPYLSLQSIWEMVARSAYTQLNYSPLLLMGTLLAMAIVYLIPPLSLGFGIILGNGQLALISGLGWLLMTIAYFPTVRFYQCSPLFALTLPGIAFLYTLMTIDSAWRHWRGKGGAWKGRVYER